MPLSRNPFGKYNGNELHYLKQFLDTENEEINGVNWVHRFEQAFAQKFGVKYAIAVNSATSGLHSALASANIGPGDEVISPSITVVMDALVTQACGAEIVYADVDPDTFNVTAETIKPLLNERTKGIIVVSLFGVPVDIDPILELIADKDIVLIEDSAETMLSVYRGQISGTKADFGVYSFENKKHMTSGGEGGMIVTNNRNLAIKARKFAGLGYKNLTADFGRTNASAEYQNPNFERHDTFALNYRMNGASAAIGLAQLERLDHLVQRRVAVGSMFINAVQGCQWILPQKLTRNSTNSFYTVAMKYLGEEKKGLSWSDFYNQFVELGGDGFYASWLSPYNEPLYRKSGAAERANCPIADKLQKQLMLFKSNYRDLGEAAHQARILSSLIDRIGR